MRPVSMPSRAKSQRYTKSVSHSQVISFLWWTHPSLHTIIPPQPQNPKSEEGGDNLRRLVGYPEPAESCGKLPASVPVGEVEDVIGL
jgi:hypothetical protein